MARSSRLERHRAALLSCRRCPSVVPPVVTGLPVMSEIYLLGQAPGVHEGRLGRPFAYTAGKTLFRWFARLGVEPQPQVSPVEGESADT